MFPMVFKHIGGMSELWSKVSVEQSVCGVMCQCSPWCLNTSEECQSCGVKCLWSKVSVE